MLHELFLLLSGTPSPILTPDGLDPSFPCVSVSERALFNSLSQLGYLHISIRQSCVSTATSHASTVARAVAGSIESAHLHAFRRRILQVESAILKRDVAVVSGYNIVSLAKVRSGFDGWERTLRYLHDLVEFISPGSGMLDGMRKSGRPSTGARIIDRLRGDIYTGYPTLEKVATHLLGVAEMAWLQEVATWVLYGRLPPSAETGDFFITEVQSEEEEEGEEEDTQGEEDSLKDYKIVSRLLPSFVATSTSTSLLFIGRALSMIRVRSGTLSSLETELTLLPLHLSYLQSLTSPLSPQKFSSAITSIRSSLSERTLQTLLPAPKILETVCLLRDFFLLGRGEFALALIEQVSSALRNRSRSHSTAVIKEGEVSSILSRTWSALSTLDVDDRLEAARDQLNLSLSPPSSGKTPRSNSSARKDQFSDLLLGVPVCLNFELGWPLELFLHQSDLEEYTQMFSYLIAVRKTQVRLQGLWKGRRKRMQEIEDEREDRAVWAAAGVAVFFLETLVAFWQSEVVGEALAGFEGLVVVQKSDEEEGEGKSEGEGEKGKKPDIWMETASSSSSHERGPGNVQPEDSEHVQQDPETLMRAHHAYLATIKRGLFMADIVFAPLLRKFLTACEAMAAAVEAMLRDEGHNWNIHGRCDEVKSLLRQLLARLQRIDEERDSEEAEVFGIMDRRRDANKVDRLLMRMDLGSLQ